MATTFKFGNGNWAVKEDYALAYNDENGNFKPLPFDFTRGSSATRVNKDGLIENVPSGKPRIDFTDNTSGHLLLEPSRKNDITDYTGASFSAFNGATITANDSNSPDGSSNATLMTTTGTANELIQQASITILSGQSYTVSGYFKLKSGTLSDPDNAFKGLDGLNGGGITGSTFNSAITSEWQRLSFTVTSSTTSGRVQIKCENAAEILIWGLQVEQGSYETSIIPTSGSAVTRNADVCENAGNADLFNDNEGVLFAEFSMLNDSDTSNRYISLSDGSPDNSVMFQITSGGDLNLYNNGTSNENRIDTYSADLTQSVKVAVQYGQNTSDYKVYVNGTSQSLNSAFVAETISGLDNLSIDYPIFDFKFNGKVKQLMVFNEALTDAELQTLTSN